MREKGTTIKIDDTKRIERFLNFRTIANSVAAAVIVATGAWMISELSGLKANLQNAKELPKRIEAVESKVTQHDNAFESIKTDIVIIKQSQQDTKDDIHEMRQDIKDALGTIYKPK